VETVNGKRAREFGCFGRNFVFTGRKHWGIRSNQPPCSQDNFKHCSVLFAGLVQRVGFVPDWMIDLYYPHFLFQFLFICSSLRLCVQFNHNFFSTQPRAFIVACPFACDWLVAVAQAHVRRFRSRLAKTSMQTLPLQGTQTSGNALACAGPLEPFPSEESLQQVTSSDPC